MEFKKERLGIVLTMENSSFNRCTVFATMYIDGESIGKTSVMNNTPALCKFFCDGLTLSQIRKIEKLGIRGRQLLLKAYKFTIPGEILLSERYEDAAGVLVGLDLAVYQIQTLRLTQEGMLIAKTLDDHNPNWLRSA